jgi:RNA polymerase sigma factor (sigma-70 family)
MEETKEGGFNRQAEAALYRSAQAGSPESLDRLLRQHEGLVRQIVAHQQLCGLPFEEALQAGRIGLWRAIEGYDPQRGTRFSTYAYPAIIRQVWDAVRRKCAWERRQVPEELLGVFFEANGAEEDRQKAEWEAVEKILRGMVAGLPERQREVIRRRYGLAGQAICGSAAKQETLAEIGGQWGVSRQRVYQIEEAALIWLRQPAHSQELRDLLGRHSQGEYEWVERVTQAYLRRRGGHREQG